MAPAPSKLYSDDVSLVVVLLDINPFFWGSTNSISFAKFLNHVIPFLNSLLLINQVNQVVLIATGVNSCGYIYDSEGGQLGSEGGNVDAIFSEVLQKLEEFVAEDQKKIGKEEDRAIAGIVPSLLSGSLSLALCSLRHVQMHVQQCQ
ncbi:uncharacterized protein A4U43_C07F37450 [Asparagus officinalis]|uniref:General transcription and DNA repair factor IIH subunit TFB4 n=1 Tax=Asparagus officinalis TaxID=4686 RepID=A0A5P1ELN1_ASPOF|nr:RNA polymerase II transcription factor B subunit 4-like isoform X2 [Asparagus officinalis]ONK65471.1 uncharacterized protein A4U43_C07F37450 [Asparagus officinalis]